MPGTEGRQARHLYRTSRATGTRGPSGPAYTPRPFESPGIWLPLEYADPDGPCWVTLLESSINMPALTGLKMDFALHANGSSSS